MYIDNNENIVATDTLPVEKNAVLPKLLIVFLAVVASFFEDALGAYLPYLFVAVMFFGFFFDRILPVCVYIPTIVFNTQLGMMQYPALAILLMSCLVGYLECENKTKNNKWTQMFFVCFFVAVSVYFGYKSNVVTGVITLVSVFSFYCFSDIFQNKNSKLVEFSLFVSGIVMTVFVLRQIINGSASYLWGIRLTFEESVRTLANAVAFSIFYAFCKLAVIKNEKSALSSKIFYLVVFAAGAYVLFMTYSRGVLLSVGAACALSVLFTLKKISAKHVIGLLAVIIFAVFWIGSMDIDTSLLGHNATTGNGRIQLWTYFVNDMFREGIIRTVFGYGPGEFTRVSQNSPFTGLYAHSLYVDALFSFGFLGFIYLMNMVLKVMKCSFATKDAYVIGFTVLTFLMYVSHGISSGYQFYLMLGLCFALAMSKQKVSESENVGEERNE